MLAVHAAQRQSEDLKSHRESVTIKGSLILPSQLTRLMEKDGLIRRLRNHIKPSTIILLDPALLWNSIARYIFDLRILWIVLIVRRPVILVAVIAASGRA